MGSGAGAWGPEFSLRGRGLGSGVHACRPSNAVRGQRFGSQVGVLVGGRGSGSGSAVRVPGPGSGSGILNAESGSGPVSWVGARGSEPRVRTRPGLPGLCAGPGSAGRRPSPPLPSAQRAGGAARTKAARVLQWVWVLVLCSGGRRVLGAPFLATLKLGFGNDTRKKGGDEMRKRGRAPGAGRWARVGLRQTQKTAGRIKTTILGYFRFYRKVRGSPIASLFSFSHSRGAGLAWGQVDGEVD